MRNQFPTTLFTKQSTSFSSFEACSVPPDGLSAVVLEKCLEMCYILKNNIYLQLNILLLNF